MDIFFVWIDGKRSILIAKSLDHIQEKSMGAGRRGKANAVAIF
jgi:hypothetical protein